MTAWDLLMKLGFQMGGPIMITKITTAGKKEGLQFRYSTLNPTAPNSPDYQKMYDYLHPSTISISGSEKWANITAKATVRALLGMKWRQEFKLTKNLEAWLGTRAFENEKDIRVKPVDICLLFPALPPSDKPYVLKMYDKTIATLPMNCTSVKGAEVKGQEQRKRIRKVKAPAAF
jgi:hypothetical protein